MTPQTEASTAIIDTAQQSAGDESGSDRSTRRPATDEVLARVEHLGGGHLSRESVVQQLRDEREHR
jgi:hypothetical protein